MHQVFLFTERESKKGKKNNEISNRKTGTNLCHFFSHFFHIMHPWNIFYYFGFNFTHCVSVFIGRFQFLSRSLQIQFLFLYFEWATVVAAAVKFPYKRWYIVQLNCFLFARFVWWYRCNERTTTSSLNKMKCWCWRICAHFEKACTRNKISRVEQ